MSSKASVHRKSMLSKPIMLNSICAILGQSFTMIFNQIKINNVILFQTAKPCAVPVPKINMSLREMFHLKSAAKEFD